MARWALVRDLVAEAGEQGAIAREVACGEEREEIVEVRCVEGGVMVSSQEVSV